MQVTYLALILTPIAILFAVAIPRLLIRWLSGRKPGVDWSNDCPGIDVLGDGGRRLD